MAMAHRASVALAAFLSSFFVASDAVAAGIAAGENFTVLAPEERLAREVLARAEALRKQIARRWFGAELPPRRGMTHITVELSPGRDEGLTLLCGSGRAVGGDHRIWLTTNRERAVGSTLTHEITHVVLAARFPGGMPAWANEGIASLADDEERIAIRRRLLRRFAHRGRWPSLQRVLAARRLDPSDQTGYTLAVSLTEFLLSRGGRGRYVRFVEDGRRRGWNTALQSAYHIPGTDALQRQWQAWVSKTLRR